MMNDLLQLGRILQQDSNGAIAGDQCASPGDDQVRLRSLYSVHCMRAVRVQARMHACWSKQASNEVQNYDC